MVRGNETEMLDGPDCPTIELACLPGYCRHSPLAWERFTTGAIRRDSCLVPQCVVLADSDRGKGLRPIEWSEPGAIFSHPQIARRPTVAISFANTPAVRL